MSLYNSLCRTCVHCPQSIDNLSVNLETGEHKPVYIIFCNSKKLLKNNNVIGGSIIIPHQVTECEYYSHHELKEHNFEPQGFKPDQQEIYGLKYYLDLAQRDVIVEFSEINNNLELLKKTPPSQFNDGVAICEGEISDLNGYTLAYIQTINDFQNYLKQFNTITRETLKQAIDYATKIQFENLVTPTNSTEQWKFDGGLLASFDILDGTTL